MLKWMWWYDTKALIEKALYLISERWENGVKIDDKKVWGQKLIKEKNKKKKLVGEILIYNSGDTWIELDFDICF